MKPYIYVMRERWVIFGVEKVHPTDPTVLILETPAVVAIWGTTEGLGQLAREGPKEGTKFNKEPNGVEINRMDIMRRIPCNERAWKKWIMSHS
jgi:hypothetical protein